MSFMRLALLLSLALSSLPLQAVELPVHQPTPGGIAIVALGEAKGEAPVVKYGKSRVAVVEHEGQWQAIVGLSLKTQPGTKHITLGEDGTTVAFEVIAKAYPEQHLTIKNKRKVNPNKADMERIRAERPRQRKAKNTFTEKTPDFSMQLPVKGPFSSQFGLKRFFNEQPRNPHGGLDIAAPRHTPIYAPAAGTVIEAGDFFFNGNCVFIDHGQGLISFYAHMTDIHVSIGETVTEGQQIGTVGDTGRVTGPHLHWSIGLNGTWIDPSLLLPAADRPASDQE